MKNKRFFLGALSLLLILAWIGISPFPYVVQAKEKSEQEASFFYQLDYPENQIKPVDYYYLKVSPNQQQKISLTLKNPTEKAMIVDLSFNQAWTNSQGIVDYRQPPKNGLSQEAISMKKIVVFPSDVELPAHAEKKVTLTLHLPQESFDGILLGGIQLKKRNEENAAEKQAGMQIKNEYVYTIAVALRETDVETPEKFEWQGLEVQEAPGKLAFTASIENQTANIVADMDVNIEIMSQESDQIITEISKQSISFAPQSIFAYPFSVNREKLPKGNYRAKLILRHKGEKVGEWLTSFEVKDELPERETTPQMKQPKATLSLKKWVSGMMILLLGVGIIVFVLVHQMSKKMSQKK